MDLILAHKRAMKICELCSLSLIIQTSFATAVSEIARSAIEYGKSSNLSFGIDSFQNRRILKAIITDSNDFTQKATEALFDLVAKEELNIRNNFTARTTDLLKKVFGGAYK